jgi:pSer/pThr/pTyr-binding forkhead associated (FHA) protein
MNWKDDRRLLKLKIFENAESFFERTLEDGKEVKVGRAEHCDLVLRSKRISREHCRFFFQDNQWRIEDLKSQNGVILNGVKVLSEALKNRDVLQIGDFRMDITWQPPGEAAPEEIDDDRTLLVASEPVSDKTIIANVPPLPAVDSGSPIAKALQPLLKNKVVMACSVILCFLLVVIIISAMNGDEPDAPEKDLLPEEQKKEAAMTDLETQHQLSAYLQGGREQFDKGNYNEALIRFQGALGIDPQNAEALSYIAQCRDKIKEVEEQKRLAAEAEKQKMERLNALLAKVRQAHAAKDFTAAQETLAEAEFLAPEDPSLKTLKADIEKTMAEAKLQEAENQRKLEENRAKLKQHFDEGRRYFDEKKYHDALREWNAVLALNVEGPETGHVQQAIPHIKKLLEEGLGAEYEKAVKAVESKAYTEALNLLHKVALVNPDYKDTKNLTDQASKALETQVRKLFQEGLVYEGLGKMEKAEEKWREVIRLVPVETNEYYQRALQKLK